MLFAIAACTFLVASQPARPFSEERLLLDRRLATLRRLLPDGANEAADAASLRQLASAARLAKLEIVAQPPVEAGARGENVFELRALAGYEEIERFFRGVGVSHRLIDVESLTITATTAEVLQLAAVLRLPFWPRRAPLPPAPESARERVVGAPRRAREAFLRDEALAFAKSDAIAARRRALRGPRLFLSELAAAVRERPVALSYAALGEDFTVRGLALGEGPLRALESRLERGFFRVSAFLISKQGVCQRFEVRGTAPVVGPDVELPVPTEDPFELDASACRSDRDASRSLVVRGRVPSKGAATGPITLRLHDVDLTDVFHALSALGHGSYVVDEAVAGRVDLELTRVSLEEALSAIRKETGVELNEVGPLRRVSLVRTPAAREVPAGGPLASFSLKRAELRDLLAALADADTSLASLGPAGFLGRASVWTRGAPAGAVRAALLDAASLRERLEDGRRVLEPPGGASEAATPVARSSTDLRVALRPDELTLREFALAGVGSSDERRVAFAYSPRGDLFTYAAGDRLFDAVVRTIETDGVVLDTDDGEVRLMMPALD